MICALTLSACTSKPSAQCLKPLPPPTWMTQDAPDWRKTLNRIMYVSSENLKPSKPNTLD
ncbi:hypothetical protein ID856_17560 [Xenorhabdus sp. 18]|uniref:Rz1 family lipoprotein n=1 Tax=Xenorhabdus doucetiae TaxID=351671 RepID=UPI0019C3C2C3|nr:Rz1 family lipoprotein [Xenorhabdus sp. 18]MBD2798299.1 hypothetical protein [Xenorhabdus sp. 18]